VAARSLDEFQAEQLERLELVDDALMLLHLPDLDSGGHRRPRGDIVHAAQQLAAALLLGLGPSLRTALALEHAHHFTGLRV